MAVVLQKNPCIVRGEYNHKEYVLYKVVVKLRGDEGYKKEVVYFFSTPDYIKQLSNADDYKPCAMPEGKLIGENKIGAPFLYDEQRGVA